MWSKNQWAAFCLVVSIIVISSFQNCGQPGELTLKSSSDDISLQGDPGPVVPGYASKSLSSSTPPPLKLVFVIDNSYSMTLNNLNLKQSITSMFDSQADNISEFDTEIYFISTAQSAPLASSFFPKLLSPSDFNNSSLSAISSQHRGNAWVSGQIAGDILGFRSETASDADGESRHLLPQPVVKFYDDGTGGLKSQAPVIYKKGSSISDLKLAIAERLDILAPETASASQEPALFSAIDQESGLCSVARVLKSPQGIIAPGDLASFIIVSDENESDKAGSKCTGEIRKDYLYSVTCKQLVPAYDAYSVNFKYQTRAIAPFVRSEVTITPQDATAYKQESKITLNRNAKAASCSGQYQKEFKASYSLSKPNFKIDYISYAKIGTREGGISVYDSQGMTGSTVLPGTTPADCLTNIARLQSAINDATSKLQIAGCSNAAATVTSGNSNYPYSSYADAIVPSSTCPATLVNSLATNLKGTITTCSTSTVSAVGIPASALTGDLSSSTNCTTAVQNVCSSSNGVFRSCSANFVAASAAESRSANLIDNSPFNCYNATCGKFPTLCNSGVSANTSIQSFANSVGMSCSATVTTTTTSYLITQNAKTVSMDRAYAINCQTTCDLAKEACDNLASNSLTIASYNKSCQQNKTPAEMAGTPSQTIDIGTTPDANNNLSCSSLCNKTTGICGSLSPSQQAATTVDQYIKNISAGATCVENHLAKTMPEKFNYKIISGIKKSDAGANSCPAGWVYESQAKTAQTAESLIALSASEDLSSYIKRTLDILIGSKASTLSAFITPQGEESAANATSVGQVYKELVETVGRGTVNNIKAPSYDPALVNLSGILKSQLQRSINFPEVTSGKKVRQVWKKDKMSSNWGNPIPLNLWSATGGTVTFDGAVDLNRNDLVQIEFY